MGDEWRYDHAKGRAEMENLLGDAPVNGATGLQFYQHGKKVCTLLDSGKVRAGGETIDVADFIAERRNISKDDARSLLGHYSDTTAPAKEPKRPVAPTPAPSNPPPQPIRRRKGIVPGDDLFRDYTPDIDADYVIDRWAERGELAMLVGPEKAGKGRLLAGLACFAAIPKLTFPGLSKNSPARTLLVMPEGVSSMRRVMCAAGYRYRKHREELRDRITILDLIERGAADLHSDDGRKIIAEELEYQRSIGRPVDLVIVDSISMTTNGEQKDTVVVNAVCMNLKKIAAEFDCAVLMAHHTNRSGSYEGSAMWRRHPVIIREIEWKGEVWRTVSYGPCRDFDGGEELIFRIKSIPIDGVSKDGFAIVDALLPQKFAKPEKHSSPGKKERPKSLTAQLTEKARDILAESPNPVTRTELVAELVKYHPNSKTPEASRKKVCRNAVKSIEPDAEVSFDQKEDSFSYRRRNGTDSADSV